MADWPPQLRTAVDLCVESHSPVLMYWGPTLSMIYNDALVPLIGSERHPWALGRPAHEVFAEIWELIEPLIQTVLDTGKASWTKDMMLPIVRGEGASEAYYSFSYTPIRTAEGEVAGIYCAVIETTRQIIDERRLRLFSALHDATGATTLVDAGAQVAKELAAVPSDIPFAHLYLRDGDFMSLGESISASSTGVPRRWRLDEGPPWSPSGGSRRIVLDSPGGPRRAVLLPLDRPGAEGEPLGYLVAGTSALLGPSASYDRFHALLATHVTRCLANAAAHEAQRRQVAMLQERDMVKSAFYEQQRRRQQSYRSLVQAPFPVAVLRGPDHVIELANPQVLQAWARTPAVVGLPIVQAIPELEGQPFVGYLDDVYATGVAYEGRAERARLARTPAGELEDVYFNFVYAPLQDDEGEVEGILVAAFEVTATVEARAASERAREIAEAAEAAQRTLSEFQERFVGVLGHDLRGPLAAIGMGAGTLAQRAKQNGDDVGDRVLTRILSSTRRMARMVDQLLDLTRNRIGGGLEVHPTPMDMAELLARVVDEVRAANPDRPLELHCPLMEGSWDADRLEQVFANLISNANHHGDSSRPLTITARGSAEAVQVEVHNYGPVIPAAVQESIFDAFRRGERESRGSNASGLGLGLYISSEIVLAHGGSLDLSSSDTEGTTFRVTLPRHTPTAPPMATPQ